jgi:hypothetical protein
LHRFVRDIESASHRLEDSSQNTTVLAPLNSAVEKLPRKPWEDPKEYSALGPNAYEGGEGQERAQRNLRRFVEAHMVPASPWSEGQTVKPVGGDAEIWWEEKDGTRLVNTFLQPGIVEVQSGSLTQRCLQIQPGAIEVLSVAGTVANGQVVSPLSTT